MQQRMNLIHLELYITIITATMVAIMITITQIIRNSLIIAVIAITKHKESYVE